MSLFVEGVTTETTTFILHALVFPGKPNGSSFQTHRSILPGLLCACRGMLNAMGMHLLRPCTHPDLVDPSNKTPPPNISLLTPLGACYIATAFAFFNVNNPAFYQVSPHMEYHRALPRHHHYSDTSNTLQACFLCVYVSDVDRVTFHVCSCRSSWPVCQLPTWMT